ncbi:hypothetical protein [Chryseobacterium gambrini]|uniref:hypothetical protein n=1 Tax=Chryseobacterium gambrini TaxID=373672 RepID=UPI003D10044B
MEKFKLNCFEYLEGTKYEKNHWNDLVMDLIDAGIEYFKTLDESKAKDFNNIERNLNEIKTKIGEFPTDYGSRFKTFYGEHFVI